MNHKRFHYRLYLKNRKQRCKKNDCNDNDKNLPDGMDIKVLLAPFPYSFECRL